MTTTTILELEQKIEQLVREHLDSTRRAAAEAVARAFAGGQARSSKANRADKTAKAGKRRTPEEVADLGERFCAAVRENPGETMTVLAGHVGASPRDLHRPMTLLKRSGRVRSVGQRHQTRYFPTPNAANTSA